MDDVLKFRLGQVSLEIDFADVTGIVLGDEEISLVVCGDGADGAGSSFLGIVKPRAVTSVRVAGGAIEEQANDAVGIDIPGARAGICSDDKCAGGQEPNGADLRESGGGCELTVTTAAGRAVARNDGSSDAVGFEAIDAMSASIGNNHVSAGIDHEDSELL